MQNKTKQAKFAKSSGPSVLPTAAESRRACWVIQVTGLQSVARPLTKEKS